MADDSNWLEGLPRSLRHRLDGIGSYVTSVLEEARIYELLKQEEVQQIQLLAFLKILHDFLLDGSDAARKAVEAFAQLGVQSFRIGNQTFEEGSDAVTRGKRLADGLREAAADPRLNDLLSSEIALKDHVVRIGRELSSGRRVG